MIKWKHDYGMRKTSFNDEEYHVDQWSFGQEYLDLIDDKGRRPGHKFYINKQDDDTWQTGQTSTRAGESFGAISVNSYKYFDDLELAKRHCESQATKAAKAVYKNKQFSKVSPGGKA